MEAFLTSTALVALAEIGDKTQLLSFVLAARLRKPWAIIAGIFVATLLNHGLAGTVGAWIADFIPAGWLPWIVGLVFIAFGIWTLKPDTLDEDEAPSDMHPAGAFVTAAIAFFIAEMGDKPQLATVFRALLEAYVALDAPGLAAAACDSLRANAPEVRFDPRATSPKIRAACGAR